MSGSFWKFGQDYSIESSVTKLLNRAFIKIENNNNDSNKDTREINDIIVNVTTTTITNSSTESGSPISEPDISINDGSKIKNDSTDTTLDKLPSNEEDYKDYKPDLNILDDLLDDEELYTELMCSNFKLLIYLKYPEVLQKLIDFVTNEKILTDDFDEISIKSNDSLSNLENNSIDDLNSDVIIVEPTKDCESDETIIKNKISEGYEEIETNLKDENDASSMISEETSVTVPPESEEQLESRRARMAAEILSADIWPIASTIMENIQLLEQLWSIMDHKPSLSVAASTYFMKINERLLDMDVNGMLTFILSQDSCAERFLNHIENPSLMDFLLKVISTDKQDSPTGIINCLKEQNLIPNLIDRLDLDKYSTSVQSAAGDFLKAFVTLSANSNNEIALGIGPNELTRQLVSTEIVEKLINIMLKGSTSLSNGVGIIIEMIRKNNSDYDFIQVMYTTVKTHPPNDRDPVHLIALVKAFANHMGDFAKLLTHGDLPMLQTPIGEIEPLGFERFKICELVAELLHCSNMALLNEPEGEKITSERDHIRQEYLREEGIANGDSINKMDDGSENDDLTYKLEALKLNGSENDFTKTENEEDDDKESLNEPVNNEELNATDENDNEVYPDDEIDNSKEAEQALREKNISGDQLKFALHDTGIITNIMDMFFQFEWNNFLHNVVFDIVQQIFNGPLKSGYNKFLLSGLLADMKITDKIIQGDEICKENETNTGIRLGYMGHLTLIAEEVAKFVEYVEELKLTFTDDGIETALNDETWVNFMDTTLRDIREKYNTVLGDFVLEDVDAEDYEDHLIEANDPELQMEENNALLDKLTEQNRDIDPLDDLDDPIEQAHDSFEQNEGNLVKEGEDYIETSEEPSTESFYKYSHNLEDDTIRSDSLEDENRRGKSAVYEYIDPSGHKTTLNLDSFHTDSDEDSENNSNYDDTLKYIYTNQFKLGDNEKTHERFSTTLQNDFIDYSPPNPDDDDDYMDPNDDGQSYVKPNNPLFNKLHTLSSNITLSEDELQSRDSESGSDIESPEDYSSDEEAQVLENPGTGNDISLYRTPSREE
ncbi:similar to Saccharomyces cerevisiae YJL098W SAP185 Protein that forms a complex with the Sit4p protein phosphatase and is required for its function [Maudiozyma saulgeensis]|uniref:Similar to Saccharomyces cerevisiae YJL098W SAP185 Protein that forms a complex with the Sit4p protein phosphatase and is required for its function n=1 Tax=Maudiozyma saulgeensis TaxID=1789683 RepID=A0A1X7R0R3_9SACH|nr:similar to Saccharomyces cerevisiae YJL098W SAP185 Protein that forms a complex with the Sit4p protein phosphatase and is required for its function [Kazachstania saulgeensis]